jgi:hypothetical protein
MENISFEKLVGQQVMLISSVLNQNSIPELVTVRGVDGGGIWIESQTLTDAMLKGLGKTMLEGTPVTFVPFWRISLAACGSDLPAISSEIGNL